MTAAVSCHHYNTEYLHNLRLVFVFRSSNQCFKIQDSYKIFKMSTEAGNPDETNNSQQTDNKIDENFEKLKYLVSISHSESFTNRIQ